MAEHGHPHHHHHRHDVPLARAALLTAGFAAFEALGGWWTGSLALVSDAGHMLTDGAALGLGAAAAWIARRPPSGRHSYGFGRAEVFAAGLNAAFMLAIALAIAYEAVARFSQPVAVKGGWAALVALLGLGVNFFVLRSLASHTHDMNARAARLHVIGDLLGSLAALVAGLAIALGAWSGVDPLASLGICLLIALSAWRLLRESLHALMEAVPRGLSVEAIGTEMARVEGVRSVHDLHVWTLSGSRTALSAHVVVKSLGDWERVLHALQQRLSEKFAIDHVTLQPETDVRPLVRR